MLKLLSKNKLCVLFMVNVGLLTSYHFETFLNSNLTTLVKFGMFLLEIQGVSKKNGPILLFCCKSILQHNPLIFSGFVSISVLFIIQYVNCR